MKDDASATSSASLHPSPQNPHAGDDAAPAAWGEPLARINKAWEAVEAKLCGVVLVAEVSAIAIWVSLNGLSRGYTPGANSGGVVFRSTVGAIVLGSLAHLLTRKNEKVNPFAVTGAVLLGLASGRFWANAGVEYGSNLLNFLQNASTLMLVGGLRGLITRFTLWVALLGGALATSRGKHINVDVLIRFLPTRAFAPVAMMGWLAASVMCFAAVVGFVDHIVITSYTVPAEISCTTNPKGMCETPWSEKWSRVAEATSADFFLMGRQMSLDVKTIPRVIVGHPYDKFLTAKEWNAWMGEADWTKHFPKQQVDFQLMDPSKPDALKLPAVNVPGGGESAGGLLVRELNFVFPFGLFMIGIRFLVRILLVLSGHVKVNPDAAHEDEELTKAVDDQHAVKGGA